MLLKAKTAVSAWGWQKRGALFAALGVLVALGQAPTDLWWLSVIALAIAFVFLPAQTVKAGFWHGWALGVGYFAISLRWIVSPFLVHIEKDGWMAPFALILMASGFALFWGAAAAVSQRFWRGSAIGFPVALVLVEMLRSLIFTGFPWALLGHILVPSYLAQTAAFGGPHLLTLLVVVAAFGLCMVMTGWIKRGVATLVGVFGGAFVLILGIATAPDFPGPIVRMIQPNAPQEEKWDPTKSPVFYNRMLSYTAEGEVPDLVVWPESAIAMFLNDADWALAEMSDAARGAPVIVGVNRYEAGLYYNSFVHLGRGGIIEGFYDKQHLVPFGEYIPGGDMLHKIGIPGFGSSYGGGFTNGSGQRTLEIPGIGAIRPLICYEGIFAEEIGGTDTRPRAMVLITNDAWFGKAAGPFQHLAQARLRAIEQGVPMVRVANTGVSAMIDAQGNVIGSIALNTAGYLDVPLPPVAPPTVYSRWGDLPLGVLLIMLCIGLTARERQINIDPVMADP